MLLGCDSPGEGGGFPFEGGFSLKGIFAGGFFAEGVFAEEGLEGIFFFFFEKRGFLAEIEFCQMFYSTCIAWVKYRSTSSFFFFQI